MPGRVPIVLAALAVCALVVTSAQAQPAPKPVRVGVLASGGPNFDAGVEPFRQRLRELGYVDGRNINIIVRNGEGRAERYPELAAELVRLPADVIVVQGNPALSALREVAKTTPIVMASIGDPVRAGFVASLAKPGGNITGLSHSEGVAGKWVELIKQVLPGARSIGVMWISHMAPHQNWWGEIQAASRSFKLMAKTWDIRAPEDFEPAFAAMRAERTDALIVLPYPMFNVHRGRISELAVAHGLPSLYPFREFVEAGTLMAYGPSLPELWRRSADYVDKILRGAKPMDLPVAQPTTFVLALNLKTAKALGLTIPHSVLVRATELIE